MRTEVIQALLEKTKEKIYIVTYPEGFLKSFQKKEYKKKKEPL